MSKRKLSSGFKVKVVLEAWCGHKMAQVIAFFLFLIPTLNYCQENSASKTTFIEVNEKYVDSILSEVQKQKTNSDKKVIYSGFYNDFIVRSKEEAITTYQYALTKETTDHGQMMLLYGLGSIHSVKGNQEEALSILMSGYEIAHRLNDTTGLFFYHSTIARIFLNNNVPDKAIYHLNQAEALPENKEIKDNLWKIYLYRGQLEETMGNLQGKVTHFKTIVDISMHLENTSQKRFILFTVADFFTSQNKLYPVEAVFYTDIWLEHFFESQKQAGIKLPEGHFDIYARFNKESSETNISSLINTFKIADSLDSSETLVYTVKTLTALYKKLNQPKRALPYLMQAEKKLLVIDDDIMLVLLYGILADYYEENDDYKNAYYYKTLEGEKRDELRSVQMVENVAALKVQFETEKKEQEIKLLAAHNTLISQQKSNQLKIFVLGLIFLTSIGFMLFYQNRQRKKANAKLTLLNKELDQANKIKTRFFSILNHDLRSPVANLISFLNLQKENPELLDEETKKRMDEKTVDTAENLLQSMEDMLLWSKGQMEQFAPQFKKVTVSNLFLDNQKVFSGYHHIEIVYLNDENLEIVTDENYLKTIIRNLTSNAINAIATVQNPKIVWKAWLKDSKNYISITDNGPGASKEQLQALYDENHVVGIKTGLGLHLIRDLAKPINCIITVESQPGEGTTFILEI